MHAMYGIPVGHNNGGTNGYWGPGQVGQENGHLPLLRSKSSATCQSCRPLAIQRNTLTGWSKPFVVCFIPICNLFVNCTFILRNLWSQLSLIAVQELAAVRSHKRQVLPGLQNSSSYVQIFQLCVFGVNWMLQEAREAFGVRLKNSILIIDEAHNLVNAVNDIHSAFISLSQISRAHAKLTAYLTKFHARLAPGSSLLLSLPFSTLEVVTFGCDNSTHLLHSCLCTFILWHGPWRS